ncbi:MAG: 2-hydroxyacid dehydrogenase [Kiloniellales bacterium]
MGRRIAIIGDNFMLPEMFREKLLSATDEALSIRMQTYNWPGDPLVHGHTTPGIDGLKEYFGTAEAAIRNIGDAEILVTHLAPVSRPMLDRLPDLKLIAVSRGGPVNVNLAACRDRGIRVVNTPGRNASAVAEFTIGAILTETRKIRSGHEALRKGVWRDDLYRADTTGRELSEMTVGIVGYGAIGRRVAKLLQPFGCRILISDPYAKLAAEDAAAGIAMVRFSDLLAQSDIVTLHSKVTEETRGMMDAAAFSSMRAGSLLINTTRGSLCDDAALLKALTDGPLSAAVLDTFTSEPLPPDSRLLTLENVTLTPHIAGASVRTVSYAAEQAAEEVRRYLSGEPPRNPC